MPAVSPSDLSALIANAFGDEAHLVQEGVNVGAHMRKRKRGSSFLGGTPELPTSLQWPTRNGKPMMFVAQIDLQDVPSGLAGEGLPASGLLLFFYDDRTWGDWPKEHDGGKVIYAPDNEPTLPTSFPDKLPLSARLDQLHVSLDEVGTLPDIEVNEDSDEGGLPARLAEAWYKLSDAVYEHPQHRFLGNAVSNQNPVQWNCPLPDSAEPVDGATDLRADENQWRLLAQFDSDERIGTLFGDGGSIYFCITDTDLRAGRFDSAFCLLQG